MENEYPYADISIEYPQRTDRLTAFFRFFLALPVLILYGLLTGVYVGKCGLAGGGFLFLPVLLVILFRKNIPECGLTGFIIFQNSWREWVLISFCSGMSIRLLRMSSL